MDSSEPNSQTSASASSSGSASASTGDDMQFTNTPNLLTALRIAFVPVVIAFLYMRTDTWDIVAAFTFIAAAITDYFDGYIARTRKLITVYGKLMDPLADKFLVVSSLVMLQDLGRIPAVVVMILVCRELGITSLRALASSEGVIIAASDSGKWKTGVQMVAIPCMMAKAGFWGIPFFQIGQVLLYVSVAISLWSAWQYGVGFFAALREKRRLKKLQKKGT